MCALPLFDGTRLHAWARRAADELDRRRIEINQLNVFPVPDADTGSNMAHTMKAAVAEADALPAGSDVAEVAEALAVGAVRGARGNSGVVLSQVIRGLAQSVAEDTPAAQTLADALLTAVRFVDRAIAEPVEGTVITVLRAAAAAAQQVVADAEDPAALDVADVARPATEAARVALANTPSQLEALRDAGVVDAGGTGLVILLEALLEEVDGDAFEDAGGGDGFEVVVEKHGPVYQAIEVMFYFRGDLDALEREIASLGDSLLVARAGEAEGKVHIHSLEAGRVIETAYAAGEVSDLRLEVLPAENAAEPATEKAQRLIVAVTPPGSLTDLYSQAGAVTVAPGQDVISEMLAAIRRSGASEIILLPNGLLSSKNLASVEKTTRAMEQTITLLPTVRLVSGIAALAVHDPDQPLATAAFTMSEAAGEMRTAVAGRAEKGALLPGGAVGKGDVVVTSRGEFMLIAETPLEAVERACGDMLERGGEQVTILYAPDEFEPAELNNLAGKLGVDVMVYPADGLGVCAEIGVE